MVKGHLKFKSPIKIAITSPIINHIQHLHAFFECSSSFFDSFCNEPAFWFAILLDFPTVYEIIRKLIDVL